MESGRVAPERGYRQWTSEGEEAVPLAAFRPILQNEFVLRHPEMAAEQLCSGSDLPKRGGCKPNISRCWRGLLTLHSRSRDYEWPRSGHLRDMCRSR